MSLPIFQLSDQDHDQLSELINIGVSHASTTLSQMIGRRIAITIPSVSVKNAVNASQLGKTTEDLTLSVLLRISGSLEGYVFLIFPRDAANRLLSTLSGKQVGDLRALDRFDRSIFQEIGNVVTGGMLTGLSQFLHMRLLQSVPEVVVDMGGAMFNSVAVAMIAQHEEFLSLDVGVCIDVPAPEISCEEERLALGRMYFFIGPKATNQVLEYFRKMTNNF